MEFNVKCIKDYYECKKGETYTAVWASNGTTRAMHIKFDVENFKTYTIPSAEASDYFVIVD
jgi:hypothetical protein